MILVSHFIDEKKLNFKIINCPALCLASGKKQGTTPRIWTQNTFFLLHTILPLTWKCFSMACHPHPCTKCWQRWVGCTLPSYQLHNSLSLKSSVKSENLSIYLNYLKSSLYKISNMHLCANSYLLAHSTKISCRYLKDFHVELPQIITLTKYIWKENNINSLYYHLRKLILLKFKC